MRPQQQRSFATTTASKLDSLELVAALLERDAVNGRALQAEMGAALLRLPRARPARWARWHRFIWRAHLALRQAASLVNAVVRSRRLRAGLRAVFAFAADFVIVLAVGCTAMIAIAAFFALRAPL